MQRMIHQGMFIASIFFLCALCGCGLWKQEQADVMIPHGADAVELVMWLVGSESQAKSITRLSKEFTEKTNISIRCEAISWGGAHSKYLTSIAGEVTPDIGTFGLTWGTEFGSRGVMVDLAARYPDDIATIQNDTFPGIWPTIEYQGKVFGIPFDLSEYILYYRTSDNWLFFYHISHIYRQVFCSNLRI